MAGEYELRNLTAEDVCRRAAQAPAVLLPLASMEILGAHGPVGLDLAVAEAVTPKIAARTGCLAAPPVPYGDTGDFCGMKGTIHVPQNVMEDYCYAVASSLLKTCRARAVIFLNVHSLNGHAASAVCRRLCQEGLNAATVDWWAAVGSCAGDILDDHENGRGHGGEMITSVALALVPEHVRMERAECEKPMPALEQVNRWNGTPFRVFGNFPLYCKGGAWGDTSAATAEKGERLLERGITAVSDFITAAFGGGPGAL